MIQITRHENHKLYVPSSRRYTNLTEIKELVQSGEKVQVIDHTGTDVTSLILSQVLVKTRNVNAETLRQLIQKGE